MKDMSDTVSSVSSLSSSEAESDDEPLKPRRKKQKIEDKGNRERSKTKHSNTSSSDSEDDRPLTSKAEVKMKKVDQNGTKTKSSDNDGNDSGSGTSQESEKENTKRKDLNQESKTGKPKMKRALKSENRKLVNLKRYLKTCGVRINNYNKLFEGCKTEKAKERKLQNMLVELGVEGRPTLAKCKKIQLKRQEQEELADLDVSNIISLAGSKRSSRSQLHTVSKTMQPQKRKYTFGDLADIVDSDGSDAEELDYNKEDITRKFSRTIQSSDED